MGGLEGEFITLYGLWGDPKFERDTTKSPTMGMYPIGPNGRIMRNVLNKCRK